MVKYSCVCQMAPLYRIERGSLWVDEPLVDAKPCVLLLWDLRLQSHTPDHGYGLSGLLQCTGVFVRGR